jgi:epoxyqueuosine reductase QueG
MELDRKLSRLALEHGADFFGIADTAYAHHAILEQGGEQVAGFPRAVSLGITLPHAVVDQLPRRSELAVSVNYEVHAYDIINLRLDLTASRISGFLQREGFRSMPIPASERYDDQRICASFSHKLGAHLAGLGWIGKSCLLITPGEGPRVRWTTVLTHAPLEPTGKPMEERCDDCRECVDICPLQAFTGRPFRRNEPREVRYDAAACDRYFDHMEKSGIPAVCGLCLFVCPYGKRDDLS